MLLFVQFAFAQPPNQVPVITNLSAQFLPTGQLKINYDANDPESDPMEIIVQISNDGGYSYLATSTLAPPSGDIGYPIPNGSSKQIVFQNASTLWGQAVKIRITALDRKPFDMALLVQEVDSSALKNRLTYLEGVRHRTTGTAHLAQTQDSLSNLFERLALGFKEQNFTYSGYTAKNLIGNKTGYAQTGQTVIVDAHYDTVSNSPGADDNGSGTVGMMEIAERLAKYPAKKGLRFIGFDLEETGLTGSQYYVSNLSSLDTIAGVFNFEMIGFYDTKTMSQTLPTGFNQLFPAAYTAVAQDSFRGNFITNVGNTASQSLVDRFRIAAQTYVPNLKVIDVVTPGTGSLTPDLLRSDHAPFWTSNRQALMITDGANFRNLNYHTTKDSLYKLNFRFMQQVTQTTLAAAADLAEVQHGSWAVVEVAPFVATHEAIKNTCILNVSKRAGAINLKFGDCSGQVIVEVFSTDGRRLNTAPVDVIANQNVTLSAPIEQSAVYFVRIREAQGKVIFAEKI